MSVTHLETTEEISEMQVGRPHPFTLSWTCCSSLVTPRGKLIHLSGALIFAAKGYLQTAFSQGLQGLWLWPHRTLFI